MNFNSPLKSTWIVQHQHLRQVKMHFSLLSLVVWNVYLVTVFLWKWNYNFLRMQWEIKLYQENVSHERTLSLDQWQICRKLYTDESFSYKITENNCRSRHFAVVIQIPKRYPTSFDKISFLTLVLLIISSQIFSWKLNSSRTFFLPNFSYLSLRL